MISNVSLSFVLRRKACDPFAAIQIPNLENDHIAFTLLAPVAPAPVIVLTVVPVAPVTRPPPAGADNVPIHIVPTPKARTAAQRVRSIFKKNIRILLELQAQLH